MGINKLYSRSYNLLRTVCHQQHLLKTLNKSQFGRLRRYSKCKIPDKPPKKTCRPVEVIKPEYFKTPDPCKTDEELRTEPTLGVYMRCKPPYKPECTSGCFNLTLLDQKLYKPSKSLDRKFQKHWVDCEIERKPKRCSGIITPPEIERRSSPPKRKCGGASVKTCRTVAPLECRPLTPALTADRARCIKLPLCECPTSRKRTLCKLKPKPATHCMRPLTRYPSYSECKSIPVRDEPLTECPKRISICEMWRVFRNRHG